MRLVTFTQKRSQIQTRRSAGRPRDLFSDQVGDTGELIEGGSELQRSVHEFLGFLGEAHARLSLTLVTLLLGRTPYRWLRAREKIISKLPRIGQFANPVVAEAYQVVEHTC